MKAVRRGMGLDTRSFEIGFDGEDRPFLVRKPWQYPEQILLQGVSSVGDQCQDCRVQHRRSVRGDISGDCWSKGVEQSRQGKAYGAKPGLTYSICFAKIRKGKSIGL